MLRIGISCADTALLCADGRGRVRSQQFLVCTCDFLNASGPPRSAIQAKSTPISARSQHRRSIRRRSTISTFEGGGARCLPGGKPASGQGITGGQFVEPTVFTDIDNSMQIGREEIFGPSALDHQLRYLGKCIRIANDRSAALRQALRLATSRAAYACQSCCAPELCGGTYQEIS